MFILCRKLKCMKGPLRQLNKLHFNYIFERVVKAEVALDHHQTLLHDDRDNIHLLTRDKELRLELMNLKAAEKMFFAQKLKCKFFKESDRGTSFFHALMSQKHIRNYIVVIQHYDGTLSNSVDEVGEEFVNFFK